MVEKVKIYMWIKVVGSAGFLLYFLYDINSITKKNPLVQKFFGAGTVLVGISTVGIFAEGWENMLRSPARAIFFGILAAVMLGLLIYTLFFALPFEATYVEENHVRKAYMEGVYALSRHPGVLWFAFFYLAAAGMIGTWKAMTDGLLLVFWNVIYICLQDQRIFPQTFCNYEEYRQMTPFLLPNRESIRRCFKTWGRGDIGL